MIRIKFYGQSESTVEKGRRWVVSQRGDLFIHSDPNDGSANSTPLFTAAAGAWSSVEVVERDASAPHTAIGASATASPVTA